MLDDREQKTLHELEEQLVREDPWLARALCGQPEKPPRHRDREGAVRAVTALAWLFASFLIAAGYVQAAMTFLSVAVVLWALWRFSGHRQVTPCFPREKPGDHR